LLIDASDTVHVAYLADWRWSPTIEYATRIGRGWSIEKVEQYNYRTTDSNYHDQLAAQWSANGQPLLSYRVDGAFHSASRTPVGSWSIENVATSDQYYATVSMQRTTSGWAVVYPSPGYLLYSMAEGQPGNWKMSFLSSGGGLLAQAPVGDLRYAYIGYSSNTSKTPLKVQTRAAGVWREETITQSTNGTVNDAVVDPNGKLWVLVGGYGGLRLYH
ncbi:MAG: hypothetical protein JRH20_29220, partial [Deltaproteobacteria bacterium]|nr:hypothetical protein [Deltaproteobacteria bacterium]